MIDEDLAVQAYRSSLQSITDIENVFKGIGSNPDFERVPSVFYASDRKGVKLIGREYEIRKKYKLPVSLLNKKALYDKYGFQAPCALENNESAQIDVYSLTFLSKQIWPGVVPLVLPTMACHI